MCRESELLSKEKVKFSAQNCLTCESSIAFCISLSAEQDLRKNFICTFHGFTFTSINIRERESERERDLY
jgi:hypothetical protein